MPTYELNLMIKTMARPELVSTLKRTAEAILNKKGVIRTIDNLGFRKMPFKMSSHDILHKEANYFIVKFDSPPLAIAELNEEYGRDIDIIKQRVYKVEEEETLSCTLHEEILPPAYRTEVQKMVEISKNRPENKYTYKFKYNSGLDYYPFQK